LLRKITRDEQILKDLGDTKKMNYLSIQGSYSQLQLALFSGGKCLESITKQNLKASSQLIPLIDEVLRKYFLNLKDLNFICVDQGPGAFTSLRVTISTVNGISFANKIPLIGIDGLDALSQEVHPHPSTNSGCTDEKNKKHSPLVLSLSKDADEIKQIGQPKLLVTLLNAYNNDVYFAVNKIIDKKPALVPEIKKAKGYKKIDMLLEELKENFGSQQMTFVGNGIKLHENLILKTFPNATLLDKPKVCSANQIAKMALKNFSQKERLCNKLSPLYLKSQKFAIK
jgi:tRNA threonylcarbamoyl adenosine modification protein YeaZ